MIKVQYLRENPPAPDYDQLIADWLDKWEMHLDGRELTIAIEDREGFIYRIIDTYGPQSYTSLLSFLKSIGLKDRDPWANGKDITHRFYPGSASEAMSP